MSFSTEPSWARFGGSSTLSFPLPSWAASFDTPVKRYSSGMYVRLAFSVAAFLEPEILIVDEALSVGDKRFQARRAQRIRDIMRDGRTIVFVFNIVKMIR